MRILTLLLFCSLSLPALRGQYALAEGSSQLNAGLGFSTWGAPVFIGFDYGIDQDVSLGAEVSFRSYRERWQGDRYAHRIIGISGNGNYHFNSILEIPQEWDVYAGVNVGFYIWSSDERYGGSRSSGLGLGAQVGGRYYFSEKFAVNMEFGSGNAFSGGKVGITVKI
jgi:outer membrane immunogenic protein